MRKKNKELRALNATDSMTDKGFDLAPLEIWSVSIKGGEVDFL